MHVAFVRAPQQVPGLDERSRSASTELGAAGARPERGESADGDTTARRDRRGARVVIGRMHVA